MEEQTRKRLEAEIRQEHGNILGLVVLRDGETCYEGYFGGCGPGDAVHVYSVTKSVVSALVGIALGQGLLQSVDQRVLDFFPDYRPKRGERTLQTVTLRDLLTMTAPYKYRSAPYTRYFSSHSWVTAALDLLGGRGPVGAFRYAPVVGPDILSGVLARAAGRPVLDFAGERLFAPLGFGPKATVQFRGREDQMDWYRRKTHPGQWAADPQGVHTAGWGLTLTAGELARLGQLYLDGGVWQGRRIVPAEWVAESTSPHSRWVERGLDYGYLWWIVDEGCFAAVGDGGSAVYVDRGRRLAAAIAAVPRPGAPDSVRFLRERVAPLFGT